MEEKSKIFYIGLRLKELRKHFKLSQEAMATNLGIDTSHFSKVERGQAFLTNAQFMELKSKYNVDLDWLISGEGSMFRQYTEPGSLVVVNEPGSLYGDFQKEIVRLTKELDKANKKLTEAEIKLKYAEELIFKMTDNQHGHHKKTGSE